MSLAEEPLGRRVLAALESRLVVFPTLKGKLTSIPINPTQTQLDDLEREVVSFVALYGGAHQRELLERVHAAAGGRICATPENEAIEINDKSDAVVRARTRALELAAKQGFSLTKRIKLAAVVSELARNIALYAGRGLIEIEILDQPRRGILVRASDNGPGIADVQAILAGKYVSKRGMGMGLRAAKTGANEFSIDTAPGKGTRVLVKFYVH
ncbi:MAG: hypothetical protein HY791_15615 [Deltaproteobacteria bacterium]|nr:hypothetical protein [Deltaproteobacteria bacterium]